MLNGLLDSQLARLSFTRQSCGLQMFAVETLLLQTVFINSE